MDNNRRIDIFLCDLTHTGQKIGNEGFPLGIGNIAAYAEDYSDFPFSFHLFKFPEVIYDAFIKYSPKIIGFSNYQWNFNLSRSYAKLIKEEFPETLIIFGGPNFPIDKEKQELFLKANRMIDFYIEGEGEVAFLSLINNLYTHDFDLEKVRSLHNPNVRTLLDGNLINNEIIPRIRNLDKIPSPYLRGKLDKFFNRRLMPKIQTTRGCPFSCTYCVEGQDYYSLVVRRNLTSIANELNYIAKRATNNTQMFIADSNFGMFKQDLESAKIILKIIEDYGYPNYIHVAMGKTQKKRILEVARILKGKLRLSGSVQSLDPVVLANIKRKNISKDVLLTLAENAKEIGANSYSEVIIALPGDSLRAFMNTMKDIIDMGFNIVLAYTLMLLPGSDLATKHSIEKYGLIRKYRVLARSFGIYHFGKKQFISGEIEEVCIGNNTMSIDDYLEARMFTLTTVIFYNDRFFEEVIETLRFLGLSNFQWLYYMHNSRNNFPKTLKEIYNSFEKDTMEELWDSREELENFIKSPENIKKLIDGDLGKNLVYYYRSLAYISCMKELIDFAFNLAKELIQEKQPELYKDCKNYLEELKQFFYARKVDLFDVKKEFEISFSYDFQKILSENLWDIKKAKLIRGKFLYRFSLSNEQKQAIHEQLEIFGSDLVGLARVFARIPINKMYRNIYII